MAKKSKGSSAYVGGPCGPSMADQKKWQVEDDLRAIERAEEIKGDRTRMTNVQKMAKEKAQKFGALANLGARKKR